MNREELEARRSEGIWRRAGRDFGAAMNRWPARLFVLAVDAVGTATGALWVASADQPAWWEIALGATAGIVAGTTLTAALVFAWNALRAPFRQRDDARREAARLRLEANPEFPRHALKIDPMWWGDIPNRHDDGETRVIFVPFDYTNREPSQSVSLDCELLWFRIAGGQTLGPFRVLHYQGRNIDRALESPVSVEPQKRIKGDLSFDPTGQPGLFEFDELTQVVVRDDYEAKLRITDQVSGAAIECPIPPSAFS